MKRKPGIYENLSFDQYVEIEAINNSYLVNLSKCPANALLKRKDTPSMAFGRAFHTYVLEGVTRFFKEYAVAPVCDKRTTVGKAAWQNFVDANPGKEYITGLDYANIKGMAESVIAHPTAKDLLSKGGKSEVTYVWTDEETGLDCKARIDRVPPVDKVLIDLKSTSSAEEFVFRRDVVNYGYYRAAAFYMEGAGIINQCVYEQYAFIVVESEAPYRTEVYTLDNEFLIEGYDRNHKWLRKAKECHQNNSFPAYTDPGAKMLLKPGYLTEGGE